MAGDVLKIKKKSVLIDASSAILLYKSGLFEQLLQHYEVVIAESVFNELTIEGHRGSVDFYRYFQENKFKVVHSVTEEINPLLTNMGKGERDIIILFINKIADFIIIDDGKGARYCKDAGIPYINALLFLKIIWFSGIIKEDAYREGFGQLTAIGRYSKKIIEFVQRCEASEMELFL